jgi:DNA-binding IclR family transcriptional regulator
MNKLPSLGFRMIAKTTSSIQVIARVARVLDAMADQDEPVSLKTLSSTTGLHPSTAFRILASLIEHGFVERSMAGHYRLGIRLLQLGNRVQHRGDRRPMACPVLPEELNAIVHAPRTLPTQGDREIGR